MTTTEREIRSVPMEVRAVKDGEQRKIVGYAARFGEKAEIGGWFTESIRKGAFTRALKEKQDIRALFNHDPNRVLGRSKSGTLTLKEDSEGLSFEIIPPDTQDARDVMALIERGDVSQCSFSFRAVKVEWSQKKGELDHRELLDVDLYDVGPVAFPAYEGTEVSMRSQDALRAERDAARAGTRPDPSRSLRLAEAM